MELSIIEFGYWFLRLAPFILVCFFSLSSIFNQDLRGVIYLIGLLIACTVVKILDNFGFSLLQRDGTIDRPELCKIMTIGSTDGGISNLPLSQTTFGYTFAYLLFFIVKNKLELLNIPTIVFFPVLILADLIWNTRFNCYNLNQSTAALLCAAGVGLIWAYIIDATKSPNLPYFVGIKNDEICSRPSKQTFKCNVFKNGKKV